MNLPKFRSTVLVAMVALVLSTPQVMASSEPNADLHGGQKQGVELAMALSQATGIAISPLFGIGAIGAFQYFRQPEELRDELPWYAQVWFWLPALIVVLLLIAKEPLLGFVPIVKKPFDALEVVENTVSGVVGSAVAIPLILAALKIKDAVSSASTSAPTNLAGFVGSVTGVSGWAGYILMAVVLTFGYFVVWLASHAINVLILLSPFGPFDILLRGLKIALLVLVVGTSLINPYLGALVSLLLLYIASRIAGWSFRLMIFGGVFAFDALTLRHRSEHLSNGSHRAFSMDLLEGTPVRTYGRVEKNDEGALMFSYRPWLVLPERVRLLPDARYHLGRGIVNPDLMAAPDAESRVVQALAFPPRYRGHEESLAASLGLEQVQDLGALKGFRAARDWVREMVKGRVEPAAIEGA